MRLFVALDIPDAIRERIKRFMDVVREFAPNVRWVRAESLHVTLKFIGEQAEQTAEQIKLGLASVRFEPLDLTFRGFGFFPTAKAARVFWIGIACGPELSSLAQAVDDVTAPFGVARESHAFSPHLTLARGGGGSGAPGREKRDRANSDFQHLQEKLTALPAPEFGTMTARELFLYQSQLRRDGAQYTKIAKFELA